MFRKVGKKAQLKEECGIFGLSVLQKFSIFEALEKVASDLRREEMHSTFLTSYLGEL